MATTMAKPAEITRKWYVIDAAGKPLGRTASKAATLLRGKHKPIFTPHVDCGDHVIIINCKDAVLTGNKLQNKKHYWHTGWIGGIKEVKYSDLMKDNPKQAMIYAVEGMLPHNRLGRKMKLRLKVYNGSNHEHQAQKPEAYEK